MTIAWLVRTFTVNQGELAPFLLVSTTVSICRSHKCTLCGADKTRVRLPDWEHFFSWRTRGLGPTRRLTGMGTPLAVPGPGIYVCIGSYAGSSNFLPWITLVK